MGEKGIMFEQLDMFVATCQEDKPSEEDLQEMFDKKNKEKKLTTRQWRLLDFIKINSVVQHRKTTQKEIYEKLKDYGYEWNDDEKCHDHCVMIWNDIKDINLSYETDKLIISDKFEYWIGNKQETERFLDKLWSDLAPRLIRYWQYLKKVNRDGQGVLLDRKLNLIDDESKARNYIESYGETTISGD